VTVVSGGEGTTGDGSFVVDAGMLPFELASRIAPITVRLRESTKNYKEVMVRQVEEEPVIEISGLDGAIPISGGQIPIEIASNTIWTASFPEFNDADWFSITPSAGTFDGPATLTVRDNSGGHAKRASTLMFRAGAGRKPVPITINQDGANVSLSVINSFPTAGNIPVEGSTYSIQVTSNAVWSITADATWSSFDPAFGDGDAIVVATVIENDLPDVRSSTITVTAVDQAHPLGISQTESEYYFTNKLKYDNATTKQLKWMKCNIIEPGEIPRQVTLGRVFKEKELSTACPKGWRIPTVREWVDAAYDQDNHTNDGKESNLWGMHDATSGIVTAYGQTGLFLNSVSEIPTLSTHIFLPFIEDGKTTTYYAGTQSQYKGVKIGPDKTSAIGYWAGADAQTEGVLDSNGQRVRCVQDL
jgi:uncharacterized protein (TIGR02145 family)